LGENTQSIDHQKATTIQVLVYISKEKKAPGNLLFSNAYFPTLYVSRNEKKR